MSENETLLCYVITTPTNRNHEFTK